MVRVEFVSTLGGEGIERKERVGAPQWTLGVPLKTTQWLSGIGSSPMLIQLGAAVIKALRKAIDPGYPASLAPGGSSPTLSEACSKNNSAPKEGERDASPSSSSILSWHGCQSIHSESGVCSNTGSNEEFIRGGNLESITKFESALEWVTGKL